MNNLILGALFAMIAQIGTFLQLQGSVKYNWYDKYPIIILLSSIPLSWLYIKSVRCWVEYFKGEIWPSRIIGFGLGIVIFSLMSHLLFKEPITLKTALCLVLASLILVIQLFMKS